MRVLQCKIMAYDNMIVKFVFMSYKLTSYNIIRIIDSELRTNL